MPVLVEGTRLVIQLFGVPALPVENGLDAQPFGLLITAVVMAWMTLLAVRPFTHPRWLAEFSFHGGLLLSEQPFYPFFVLVGVTALAGVEGDLDTVVGWIALMIVTAVSIGLAVIAIRATRATGVLDEALDVGLGAGWRLRARGPRRRRLPLGHIVFAPFATRRRGVRVVRNVRYGEAGRHNLLDIYSSRAGRTDAGVFVFFHGGGFRSGRKSFESRVLLNNLASEGWVCVSANYRVGRSVDFPDYLVDAKRVIAWVRAHESRHGGDASRIVVGGSSAGAHLASMCALTPDHREFQPGFDDVDTSIGAAVCLYGWYGKTWGSPGLSSPHDVIPPAAGVRVPPFFVAHGDNDTLVPVAEARRFVARLRNETDARVVYAELPRAQHAFDLFHSIRSDAVARAIECFLAEVVVDTGAPVRRDLRTDR